MVDGPCAWPPNCAARGRLVDLAAGVAQVWASEHIPELEAIGSLSAITFVVCRRLAAIEAARSARIAALPRVQRVQCRRGGAPAPPLDVVLELSSKQETRMGTTQGE